MSARYAIYLAPDPLSPLWRFGSHVLGYDAATGADLPGFTLPGFDVAEWHAITQDPRKYGLHITLKAPFRLAEGASEAALLAAVSALVQEMSAFDVGELVLEARLDADGAGFLCLVPQTPSSALAALEARSVVELDRFRAPLNASEMAKRRPESLPPRERDYLNRYGYPYILDAYRPHFSLTGRIPEPKRVENALRKEIIDQLGHVAFTCNALVVFRQATPENRFQILNRYQFLIESSAT